MRTGKDPDGNDLPELILGGPEDTYNQYLLHHQHTAYPIQFNSLIPISLLQPHISLEPACFKPNQPKKLYIWRSKDDDKVRPEHADRDDKIFHWNSDEIKPGEDYGCRCYAEFLDQNGKPNGEYGRIAWPAAGTESNPQPYYEPSDKNGKPLHEKNWKTLTPQEKELRRQEELAKFKNSDRLRENIKIAKYAKNTKHLKLWWFIKQVRTGGPWDYKKNGHPEMEHVGNFNYGATGTALGFSEQILKREVQDYNRNMEVPTIPKTVIIFG